MIAAAVVGASVLGLVVVYMRRPNFRRVRLSAARFLVELPQAQRTRVRWNWGAPLRSPRFWLRAAVLACLLAALLVDDVLLPATGERRLGVHLVIDTSYSMSTAYRGATRYDAGVEQARAVMRRAERYRGDVAVCVVASAVDTEIRRLGRVEPDGAWREAVVPRPAGGSATLLRRAAKTESGTCPITHAVVISDLAAPSLATEAPDGGGVPMIWLSVGAPADNLGITAVHGRQAALSGHVDRVRMAITRFGNAPPVAAAVVRGPDGGDVAVETFRGRGKVTRVGFAPARAGDYRVSVRPGGAYDGDDRAVVSVPQGAEFAVDWRLADVARPRVDGWRAAGPYEDAGLRVAPLSQLDDDRLSGRFVAVVGRYGTAAGGRIGYFVEDSPLLEGVNFDVLERHAPGDLGPLPPDFVPVMSGVDGGAWMAVRQRPRAAIVPAPAPTAGDAMRNLSLVVFFNALSWVTSDRIAAVDATLETASGEIVVAGFGEGDTARAPRSRGRIEAIVPTSTARQRTPVWPWIVAVALVLLGIERAFAAGWRSTGR